MKTFIKTKEENTYEITGGSNNDCEGDQIWYSKDGTEMYISDDLSRNQAYRVLSEFDDEGSERLQRILERRLIL